MPSGECWSACIAVHCSAVQVGQLSCCLCLHLAYLLTHTRRSTCCPGTSLLLQPAPMHGICCCMVLHIITKSLHNHNTTCQICCTLTAATWPLVARLMLAGCSPDASLNHMHLPEWLHCSHPQATAAHCLQASTRFQYPSTHMLMCGTCQQHQRICQQDLTWQLV